MIIRLDRNPSNFAWTPTGKVADGSGGSDVFHVRFDPESESVVHVIVRSVAAIHNVNPVDLAPLAESIDPETLEKVLDVKANERLRGADITFEYQGLNVTVDSDGDVWIEWE